VTNNCIEDRFKSRALIVSTLMLVLGACSTTQETMQKQEDVRNTEKTAPTELQIACASAAPSRLQLTSENILPTQSSEIQPNIYRVELKGKGVIAECIIDANGQIQAITRL
jgi:hypothetical protein